MDIIDKATEKQINYLIILVERYYDCNVMKRRKIIDTVKSTGKLSKRDASTAIGIMKKADDLKRQAWAIIRRGGCGSDFYAMNTDIYDTSDDDTLDSIWAKI